jgi:hypothetical protein
VVKEKLLTYEKQNVQINYKFGVLFSREHQTTEDQMYNNGTIPPTFFFLRLIWLTESCRHSNY